MEDIKKILSEKKIIIDKVIEKYIPRRFDNKTIEFICGKPRYKYNIEAPQQALSKPLWEFLDRGGKRWRPALFLLLIEALGDDPKKYMDFVIIPEVVHNGSLIVDDIEDNSDIRRDKPCCHKIFGVDVAINCGNAMYFLPLLSLIKSREISAETKNKIYGVYAQEMISLSFGQAMDIAWHKGIANADKITEGEYLQMCAYKTGTLARMSAKIAAILVGVSDRVLEKIGYFAESIGVAFQIQDDILNLIGEVDEYGKEIGGDISEGKRTLMVIHTLQIADEKDKKRLKEILYMHTKDQKLIDEAIEIIKKYDSINYAKNFARKMINDTWCEIDKLLKKSEAKNKLKAFVDFLVEREF